MRFFAFGAIVAASIGVSSSAYAVGVPLGGDTVSFSDQAFTLAEGSMAEQIFSGASTSLSLGFDQILSNGTELEAGTTEFDVPSTLSIQTDTVFESFTAYSTRVAFEDDFVVDAGTSAVTGITQGTYDIVSFTAEFFIDGNSQLFPQSFDVAAGLPVEALIEEEEGNFLDPNSVEATIFMVYAGNTFTGSESTVPVEGYVSTFAQLQNYGIIDGIPDPNSVYGAATFTSPVLSVEMAAVPLPPALPLMGAALFGLGVLRRRKRSS